MGTRAAKPSCSRDAGALSEPAHYAVNVNLDMISVNDFHWPLTGQHTPVPGREGGEAWR
jgi:hypothetical protein